MNDEYTPEPLDADGISPTIRGIYGDVPYITDEVLRVLSNDPLSGSDDVAAKVQAKAYAEAYPFVLALHDGHPDRDYLESAQIITDALAALILMIGAYRENLATGDESIMFTILAGLELYDEGKVGLAWGYEPLEDGTVHASVTFQAMPTEEDQG